MLSSNSYISLDTAQSSSFLPLRKLIETLRTAFVTGCVTPPRHHHTITVPGEPDATLLLMPSWQEKHGEEGFLGVKLVNVFPGNAKKGLPGLTSSYLLFDSGTGAHLATIDGNVITARRTVAVSALAASFLSRENATKLLVVGSGRVASLIPVAYRAIRGIEEVLVWDINPESANRLVEQLRSQGLHANIVTDLETGARWADIISCATLSTMPLIKGSWLQPGVHVDLIGAFTPNMRETDDEAVAMSQVYVDAGEAFHEAGDLIQPIRTGVFREQDCCATLEELCKSTKPGRTDPAQITLFKAVGTALSDLAAATLAYKQYLKAS